MSTDDTRTHGRGREVTNALTEIRTVLSRAETALAVLDCGPSEWRQDGFEEPNAAGYRTPIHVREADPDQDEMVDALREVVVLLARWRRTGRPLKGDKA